MTGTRPDELATFELAVRDLVGIALRSVEDIEVSLPQYRLLVVLSELGRPTSGGAARALGVPGSSVTRLADRLETSGHLTRGRDPAKRTIVTLELTDRGRAVVEQVNARRRRRLTDVLQRLDPTQRAATAAGLRSLHAVLDEQ